MPDGMFDFFTERARQVAGGPTYRNVAPLPPEEEERRRRRLRLSTMIPPAAVTPEAAAASAPVGAPVVGTSSADSGPMLPERPRLATPPPAPLPAVPQMSETENQLQTARLRTAGYRDVTGPAVYDEKGRQISGKPLNNDRGVLGRIGDILRQAVISAGEGYNNTPGTAEEKLMGAIGGGLSGGFVGGFKPTIDEERQRLRDIGRSESEEQRLMGIQEADLTTRLNTARAAGAEAQPLIDFARVNAANIGTNADLHKAKVENLYKRWNELATFDPNSPDPQIVQMMLEAKALNVGLPKKEPNKEYYGSWSPNGVFAILDKATGEARTAFGGQSFAKPDTPTRAELPDSLFPWFRTIEDIKRQARAEQPSDVQGALKLSDEADRYFRQIQDTDEAGEQYLKYVNPDGTLNESKIIQNVRIGLDSPPAGIRLYENEREAKRAEAAVARREKTLVDSQRNEAAQLETFRLKATAMDKTAAQKYAEVFNDIMATPAAGPKARKERENRLKQLFESMDKR